jgi:uncharacterized protein (TIGR02145 family)
LPTTAEWEAERASWVSGGAVGAFASPLKLVMAGYRYSANGAITNAGVRGAYWSSTVNGSYSQYLYYFGGSSVVNDSSRSFGYSVRCIKD